MKKTINEYDEIKLLLSRSRKLTEQVEVRQSIDDTPEEGTNLRKKEKSTRYQVVKSSYTVTLKRT